jgi:Predicted thioesterase involved in non-ribosomal peptide biosynthesis
MSRSKKIQLLLLPFAGGSSASFHKLLPYISPQIEVAAVEYAGRGKRIGEPLIEDYDLFLEDSAKQINECIDDRQFAVLGYSLGAAIAYDLIANRYLKRQPIHAFMCARGSLKKTSKSQLFADLSGQEFLQKMEELGGMDERILNNKRFLDIYMRPVKADYRIWSQFTYCEKNLKLPCDITAVYCSKDSLSDGIAEWESMTDGKVDYYEMGHNHFFINQHYEEIAHIINEHLKIYM